MRLTDVCFPLRSLICGALREKAGVVAQVDEVISYDIGLDRRWGTRGSGAGGATGCKVTVTGLGL